MGDFNVVLSQDERLSKARVDRQEIDAFLDCYNRNNIYDAPTTGQFYTWCNNQHGDSRVWAKLDKVIFNPTVFQRPWDFVMDFKPQVSRIIASYGFRLGWF